MLTTSRREQTKLKAYSSKLPAFQQYLMQQDDEFLQNLDI